VARAISFTNYEHHFTKPECSTTTTTKKKKAYGLLPFTRQKVTFEQKYIHNTTPPTHEFSFFAVMCTGDTPLR